MWFLKIFGNKNGIKSATALKILSFEEKTSWVLVFFLSFAYGRECPPKDWVFSLSFFAWVLPLSFSFFGGRFWRIGFFKRPMIWFQIIFKESGKSKSPTTSITFNNITLSLPQSGTNSWMGARPPVTLETLLTMYVSRESVSSSKDESQLVKQLTFARH